jgi:hypothetical protein
MDYRDEGINIEWFRLEFSALFCTSLLYEAHYGEETSNICILVYLRFSLRWAREGMRGHAIIHGFSYATLNNVIFKGHIIEPRLTGRPSFRRMRPVVCVTIRLYHCAL